MFTNAAFHFLPSLAGVKCKRLYIDGMNIARDLFVGADHWGSVMGLSARVQQFVEAAHRAGFTHLEVFIDAGTCGVFSNSAHVCTGICLKQVGLCYSRVIKLVYVAAMWMEDALSACRPCTQLSCWCSIR